MMEMAVDPRSEDPVERAAERTLAVVGPVATVGDDETHMRTFEARDRLALCGRRGQLTRGERDLPQRALVPGEHVEAGHDRCDKDGLARLRAADPGKRPVVEACLGRL